MNGSQRMRMVIAMASAVGGSAAYSEPADQFLASQQGSEPERAIPNMS